MSRYKPDIEYDQDLSHDYMMTNNKSYLTVTSAYQKNMEMLVPYVL